jgi:ABC-type nitrate/sulfonate/bicarbonate transport system substrate-binding protein
MSSTPTGVPRRRPAARSGAWLAAAASVSLVLAGCGSDDDEAAAAEGGTTPVNLSFEWTCEGNWAIAYLGEEQGYFADEGVDLSFERGQGGSTTTPLVAQGEYDLAVLSAPPVVLGAGQGLPITVIGVAASESPVVVLGDPGITTPEDLEGKSVAVQTDQFEGAVWEAFVAETGIDESSIEVVPSDDAAQAQFISGEIDAIVTFYPTPSTLGLIDGRAGEESVLRMQDSVPTYGHTIVANNDFLADNGDAVRGFTTAWAQSTKYAEEHPDEALTALTSNCPELDADAAQFTLDAYLDAYASDYATENGYLAFDPEGLDETADVLVSGGLMEETDLSEFSSQDHLPEPAVTP